MQQAKLSNNKVGDSGIACIHYFLQRTFEEVNRDSALESLQLPAIRTVYCTTAKQCVAACSTILFLSRDRYTVWGFDCEWKVEFKRNGSRPIALMQFASPRFIALFHVASCGLPPPLIEILMCDTIFKVGVNISGDVSKLCRDFSLTGLRGIIDLRTLSTAVGDRPSSSLSGLVRQYLRQELPKPQDTRLSDWEVVPLSLTQQHYAALDAYSGYLIYDALRVQRCNQLNLESDVQDEYMFSLLNKVILSSPVDVIKRKPTPAIPATQPPHMATPTTTEAVPVVHHLSDASRALLVTLPQLITSSATAPLGVSTAECSYKLFISGKAINDIAISRSLKPDTIVNHILKTIERGHGYNLELFGMSNQDIEHIVEAYVYVHKVLKQSTLLRTVMDTYTKVCGEPTEFWKLRVVAVHMVKVLGEEWKELFSLDYKES